MDLHDPSPHGLTSKQIFHTAYDYIMVAKPQDADLYLAELEPYPLTVASLYYELADDLQHDLIFLQKLESRHPALPADVFKSLHLARSQRIQRDVLEYSPGDAASDTMAEYRTELLLAVRNDRDLRHDFYESVVMTFIYGKLHPDFYNVIPRDIFDLKEQEPIDNVDSLTALIDDNPRVFNIYMKQLANIRVMNEIFDDSAETVNPDAMTDCERFRDNKILVATETKIRSYLNKITGDPPPDVDLPPEAKPFYPPFFDN